MADYSNCVSSFHYHHAVYHPPLTAANMFGVCVVGGVHTEEELLL